MDPRLPLPQFYYFSASFYSMAFSWTEEPQFESPSPNLLPLPLLSFLLALSASVSTF